MPIEMSKQEEDDSRSKRIIQCIMKVIKASDSFSGSQPGFAHAMSLSFDTVDPNKFLWNDSNKTLTYRYSFRHHNIPTRLGVMIALMDELSSLAFYGHMGTFFYSGVSLQMQAQFVVDPFIAQQDKQKNDVLFHELDITSSITKLGRTIAFTQTEFRLPHSNLVVATSSHIKYISSQYQDQNKNNNNNEEEEKKSQQEVENMDFTRPKTINKKSLIKDVIQSHLQYKRKERKAIFDLTNEHTNPMGAMHGGCHAVLIDVVGTQFVQDMLHHHDDDEKIWLMGMQVEYLSAARNAFVEIHYRLVGVDSTNRLIHVQVVLKNKNKIISIGKLQFITTMDTTEIYQQYIDEQNKGGEGKSMLVSKL